MLFLSHTLIIKRKPSSILTSLTLLSFISLTTAQQALASSSTSTATLDRLKVEVTTETSLRIDSPKVERRFTQHQYIFTSIQRPSSTYFLPQPSQSITTETTTQVVYLPVQPTTSGPSQFLHPLAIILILCSILGFISTLINLPFATFAMSSSSSAKPSSSSSKPSSSSSSSSRPSSSSSGSGSSSSSSSSSKPPPAPQPVPTISANAWMSFFLFCCLVLIILQGPLGLTGGNILPSFSTIPSFGYGYGYGGMPGCAGMVSTYVPWCQQQSVPQTVQQPSQIQVQQVVQNTPGGYGVGPGAMAAPQYQLGGQGGFASPHGGGGWSWYSNAGSVGGPVVRQQPGYYPAQQRTVQYQRPGLQIQINNARGGNTAVPQHVAPQCYYNTCPTDQHRFQYRLPYGYTTSNRCTPWQPWNCNYLPPIFAYAHSLPSPPIPIGNGKNLPIGGDSNVYIQSQHVGSGPVIQPQPIQAIPAVPVTPPPQPILPPPSAIASISNLENAFYPLLVAAIALLVVFDYASQSR
ncbi:hypothetical protein L486_04488 [Kwoniella mangroviensis CBS 10435]|uniref:Uncharacterized protein n=1 Tax=Kwoniella mangroviensis CBS 10435 TaxID=1331196 RepID=A0A1B9ISF4_9TREE|nr:hypothetical protein L486_04488 [Kwoniella mangroviensis CBS 10435]